MRFALVISSLRGGGSERVITHLANGWAGRGNEVRILTFDVGGPTAYPLHERVRRVDVAAAPSVIPPVRVWDRIMALRRELRGAAPDVIISFGDKTNIQTLLAARGLRIPVAISERSDPRMWKIPRRWAMLRRWTYPSADVLTVPTHSVRKWAEHRFSTLPIAVIPNPVNFAPLGEAVRRKVVVAAGRLIPIKRFDDLLRAFARLADRHPEWRLEIYGEGPEREALLSLAVELGIEGRFSLPGFVKDLSPQFAGAGLFALSSEFEGFPNALVEAMALGTPAVATNCKSGPSEIIHEGVDGRLVGVGDVEEMSEALSELMSDEPARLKMGAAATAVQERFRLTHVLDLWEETLQKCMANRAGESVELKSRAAA